MATAEMSTVILPRSPQGEFRNEPFIDFSNHENAHAMKEALVHVGDLLILKSSVNRAFNTSMEVGVKVWVENTIAGTHRHVASAYLTFVAVDSQGRRVPGAGLEPATDEDKRRYDEAVRRREMRQKEQGLKRASKAAETPAKGLA